MNILDLPDEMLLSIFHQCPAVDALNAFVDLHPRLDRIVCAPLLVRHLNFTVQSWNGEISAMQAQIVDRVSDTILPRINDRIAKFTLDPYAMRRVLTASIDYPSLSSLSLLNFPLQAIVQQLTGKTTVVMSMN